MGVEGEWGWDVESPHVLPSLFRANETGVGSPRAKIESEVGGRIHEPEV